MISTHSLEEPPLTQTWAQLGMGVGCLSFVDFLANLMRLGNYATFQIIAQCITVFNTVLLLPIWILWLGKQLETIQIQQQAQAKPENQPLTTTATTTAPKAQQQQQEQQQQQQQISPQPPVQKTGVAAGTTKEIPEDVVLS